MLKQIKQILIGYNLTLLILAVLLVTVGLINLYSATSGSSTFYKQLYVAIGSLIICILLSVSLTPKFLEKISYYAYFGMAGFLSFVLLWGSIGGGSRRWIDFGFFNFQPSELSKVAIAMAMARFISKTSYLFPYSLKNLILPFLIIFTMFGLILVQPDLGTAGVVSLVAVTQLAFAKIQTKTILTFVFIGCLTVPVLWFGMHDYQKQRVTNFLSPTNDPKGTGYQSIQAIVAVGSGRINGKGYQKGTQTHLQFLPERHTDFIFSVLAEEHGFVGGMSVFILFTLFLLTSFASVFICRDTYGKYLAIGLTSMVFWQFLINSSMVMGMFPVVGVTLPFFSYGGSSIMTNLIGVGLMLAVTNRTRF